MRRQVRGAYGALALGFVESVGDFISLYVHRFFSFMFIL